MISLDLTKSSEVRKAGDRPNFNEKFKIILKLSGKHKEVIRLAHLGYLPTNYYSRGFEYRTDIIPAVIERLHHYLEEFKVLISWLWHRFK